MKTRPESIDGQFLVTSRVRTAVLAASVLVVKKWVACVCMCVVFFILRVARHVVDGSGGGRCCKYPLITRCIYRSLLCPKNVRIRFGNRCKHQHDPHVFFRTYYLLHVDTIYMYDFRTPVSFWGQTTCILSGVSPHTGVRC